jgi:hypothetical protein
MSLEMENAIACHMAWITARLENRRMKRSGPALYRQLPTGQQLIDGRSSLRRKSPRSEASLVGGFLSDHPR